MLAESSTKGFTPQDPLPEKCRDAALWWLEFGLQVAPMDRETKHTRLRWQPWLDRLNSGGHSAINAEFRQTDELCAIVDDTLFILDADGPDALAALHEIEQKFDTRPNLVVQTRKGEHHYFKRAAGTYARARGYSTANHPERIDIRTARSGTEGRSVIVLPPSAGKQLKVRDAGNTHELIEVGQDFIDAVFQHNGEMPPRPPGPKQVQAARRIAGESEAAEILSYIPADCDYHDWLNVLFGVHNMFEGSEAGLYLVDRWSAEGANYAGFEEIEYKYGTMRSDGGVAWPSVCHLASLHGADLAAIARHYDAEGNRLPDFVELLDLALQFDKDTPPDQLKAVLAGCARLSALEQTRVYKALKTATGLPIGDLKRAVAEINAARGYTPDHLTMARTIISHIGLENIISAEAHVYAWDGAGLWQILDDRTFKQMVQTRLPDQVEEVSAALVSSVTDLVRTEIHKGSHRFNVGDPEIINCANGEVELQANRWVLAPHRREHYRTTRLPVVFDPSAVAPRFTQFLNEVFEGDPDGTDKATVLMEMVGYTLMAHCRHEKFVILVGGGANGKSVLLAVLEALCGPENVAGVQPSQFGNTFQRAHLHNKLANIVTEVKQGEVIDDATLKGIVSGEATTVEKKFCDPFLMRPFSTCWFGTNHMPHTRDFSDALFRRVLVVQFNQVFKPDQGNCDPLLKDKLVAELPGILNLALRAYQRALVNGFTQPMSCIEARNQWRLEADQVAQFVEDMCRRTPGAELESSTLYMAFKSWARDAGINRPLGVKSFRNRMTLLGFGEHRRKNARMVTGITLEEPNDELLPMVREVTGVTGAPTFRV